MINTRMEEFHSELTEKEGQGFTSGEEFNKEVVEKVDRLYSEIEGAGLNFGWNIDHAKHVQSFFSNLFKGDSDDKGGAGNQGSVINSYDDILVSLKKVLGLFISGLLISFGHLSGITFLEP